MIRVANAIEKNVVTDPPNVQQIPAGVAVTVLPNISTYGPNVEFIGRYVQNTGANGCVYAFGATCEAGAYHGYLAANQQLDCSNHPQEVSIFSTAGTTIAVTVMRRGDLSSRGGILQGTNTSGEGDA